MSPSFSSKNGVRYRFYVSTALRGRKHKAGSVPRISAPEIEGVVERAVRERFGLQDASGDLVSDRIERVVLFDASLRITFKAPSNGSSPTTEMSWTRIKAGPTHILPVNAQRKPDQKLLQAVVRSHAWLANLKDNQYASIEELAEAVNIHPKVVRQALRLAFLAPELTSAILEGDHPERLTLRQIPKRLPLAWSAGRELQTFDSVSYL
jgi:site-specific DNA recombinase